MPYWFFLSYAHRDAKKNEWFTKFFTQLALEVGSAAGLPANVDESEIGFVDKTGIDLGDNWPETLAEALQSSNVFLCLYSKSFFQSPDCGKEFEVFRYRVRDYRPPPNKVEPPRLIIPILWDKPNRLPQQLPDAVSNLQYTHEDFGEEYARHGLFHLMKMENNKEVANVISELADRIVKQAELHPLPRLANLKPLKDVQSAFYAPLPPQPAALANIISGDLPPTATPPSISGPDVAWHVYFAGRGIDYQGTRKDVSCYGNNGGYQWKPFLPPKNESIGALAPQIAGKRGLTSQVLPVSKELIDHLRKAEKDNTIAVLIVDPWSAKVESFNQLLCKYDEYRLQNCGVVIVWNLTDPEAAEKRDELKAALQQAFSRNLNVVDEVFRDTVLSEEELVINLGEVIDKVKTRLLEKSQPARPVPSNGGESFPNLNGTSGAR
jgi:FxsC-like protein